MQYCLPVEFYTISERRRMPKNSALMRLYVDIVNILGGFFFVLFPLVIFLMLI